MKFTSPAFSLEIERAITFLVSSINKTRKTTKPVILHSIRVGLYLNQFNYDKETVIAGFLHDILEDSDVKIEEVEKNFSGDVSKLVKANTYDKKIKNKTTRYKELVNRCLKNGKNALLIKAADILDNSYYYHLVEDKRHKELLLEKVKYFLNTSKQILNQEVVYKDLTKQYKKLKT